MNRIKDYASVAARFAGLGYIVLWPLTSPELTGRAYGASAFCRDNSPGALDFLCNSAPTLQLPPGLHALGFMSAVYVIIRLLVYGIRRFRRSAGPETTNSPPMPIHRIQIVTPRQTKWKAPPLPLRSVKPRAHFGLRGMPH
jgi:hypothetical protein